MLVVCSIPFAASPGALNTLSPVPDFSAEPETASVSPWMTDRVSHNDPPAGDPDEGTSLLPQRMTVGTEVGLPWAPVRRRATKKLSINRRPWIRESRPVLMMTAHCPGRLAAAAVVSSIVVGMAAAQLPWTTVFGSVL